MKPETQTEDANRRSVQPVCSASEQPIDLYAEHAKEKYGLPGNWRIYRWACQPPNGKTVLFLELSGAVAPNKKNGHPNWRKLEKPTECTITLTVKEHDEWKLEWEKRTGKCYECTGSGNVFAEWSAKDGTKYRQCPRCKGTKMPNDGLEPSGVNHPKPQDTK